MVMTMGRHLMGAREIEDRLGVSRQRVSQLTARPDWPEPYDELAMGKVWRIADVENWIRANRPDLEPAPTSTITPTLKGGSRSDSFAARLEDVEKHGRVRSRGRNDPPD